MNKEAEPSVDLGLALQHMTPAQLLIYSSLVGGGAYGGLRLVRELSKSMSPSPDVSTIKIDAPRQKKELSAAMPVETSVASDLAVPEKQADDRMGSTVLKTLALAGGLPLGFGLTAAAFNAAEKKRQEEQLKALQQQYATALAASQQKMAEQATPNVDALCNGLVEMFEKEAGLTDALQAPFNLAEKVFAPKDPYPGASVSAADVTKDVIGKTNAMMGNVPSDATSLVLAAAILSSPMFYMGIKHMAEKGKKPQKPMVPQVELNNSAPTI